MASGTISLTGSLSVNGGSCVSTCGSGGSDITRRALALSCSGKVYQSVVSYDVPAQVNTGVLGVDFEDVDLVGDLIEIQYLYARVLSGEFILRFDPEAAILEGSGAAFPTGFVGGETLNLDLDGTPVAVVFDVLDQSLTQVLNRINAACALAGLPTPRAVGTLGGQVSISSVATGPDATAEVVGGTAAATLGLSAAATTGGAKDIPLAGTFMYDPGNSTQSIPQLRQWSGNGQIQLLAAGRTT